MFNADPSCGINFNCTESELGHLFYNEFGLNAFESVSSLFSGTNANFNLFTNVQANIYWSDTEYGPDTSLAWLFDTSIGGQRNDDKDLLIFALAVRDGDVAAIPEPGVLAMFGLGLFGLVVRKR